MKTSVVFGSPLRWAQLRDGIEERSSNRKKGKDSYGKRKMPAVWTNPRSGSSFYAYTVERQPRREHNRSELASLVLSRSLFVAALYTRLTYSVDEPATHIIRRLRIYRPASSCFSYVTVSEERFWFMTASNPLSFTLALLPSFTFIVPSLHFKPRQSRSRMHGWKWAWMLFSVAGSLQRDEPSFFVSIVPGFGMIQREDLAANDFCLTSLEINSAVFGSWYNNLDRSRFKLVPCTRFFLVYRLIDERIVRYRRLKS